MKKCVLLCLCLILLFAASACAASPSGSKADEPQQSSASSKTGEEAQTSVSEEAQQQTAAIIEPSALISQEEAQSLTGKKLGKTEDKEQPAVGLKLCAYESEDNDLLQVGLTQQAFMKNGGNTPESIFKGILEAFPDAKKAEGVGDEAYFATPGIHIMKSGYYISISLGLQNEKEKEQKLIEAGKLAVVNLEAALKK